MKIYSIEKIGSDYVVKVDDQRVMKLRSKRRAAQLILEAQGLLRDGPLAAPGLATAPGDRDGAAIRLASSET
jgi:hypothetical protein